MKKLIRSRETGCFLTRSGKWTPVSSKAWGFAEVAEAQKAKRDLHLQNVELFFSSGDDRLAKYDFALPLAD